MRLQIELGRVDQSPECGPRDPRKVVALIDKRCSDWLKLRRLCVVAGQRHDMDLLLRCARRNRAGLAQQLMAVIVKGAAERSVDLRLYHEGDVRDRDQDVRL